MPVANQSIHQKVCTPVDTVQNAIMGGQRMCVLKNDAHVPVLGMWWFASQLWANGTIRAGKTNPKTFDGITMRRVIMPACTRMKVAVRDLCVRVTCSPCVCVSNRCVILEIFNVLCEGQICFCDHDIGMLVVCGIEPPGFQVFVCPRWRCLSPGHVLGFPFFFNL